MNLSSMRPTGQAWIYPPCVYRAGVSHVRDVWRGRGSGINLPRYATIRKTARRDLSCYVLPGRVPISPSARINGSPCAIIASQPSFQPRVDESMQRRPGLPCQRDPTPFIQPERFGIGASCGNTRRTFSAVGNIACKTIAHPMQMARL
jgi:hypothetical protein